jgi:hypothetical protein
LVEDQQYIGQLIIYIHLNPVRAGLVDDPLDYVFCGHREMLGRISDHLPDLLDVDDALLGFGVTAKRARRTYLKRLNGALVTEARTEVSERLPWWRPERDLKPADGRVHVHGLGRSTGLERRVFDAREFVKLACAGLKISIEALACARQDRKTTRSRQIVATLGIGNIGNRQHWESATLGTERWRQRAGKLGAVLGKHPDVISRWARKGAERKSFEPEFSEAVDQLDVFLARASPAIRNNQ